jgi:hypothetical protein
MSTSKLHRQNAFRVKVGQCAEYQVLSAMAERGDAISLFRALRDGASITCAAAPDERLPSLLHAAARANQAEVFCLLYVCGADMNQKDSRGRTVASMSRRNGKYWKECSVIASRTREVPNTATGTGFST